MCCLLCAASALSLAWPEGLPSLPLCQHRWEAASGHQALLEDPSSHRHALQAPQLGRPDSPHGATAGPVFCWGVSSLGLLSIQNHPCNPPGIGAMRGTVDVTEQQMRAGCWAVS